MTRNFSSNKEFFDAVSDLILRMEKSGQVDAAREIRLGFACINGLTDGWALFMEAIDKVLAEYSHSLPADQSSELKTMLNVVKKVVYRKPA